VATDTENPYANYHIDDWNWEFLKRNSRYRKAYKAVQWLKAMRNKLTELGKTDFGGGQKKSYEIATKVAYRNGGPIGMPKAGPMDCTMMAAAPVLPAGYVVNASRIADRRIMLAGYRLTDLLTRVVGN
jgi:hypothetical protein